MPPQAQGAGGPLGGVAGLPMGDLSLTGGVGGAGQLLEPETVYLYIPNVAVGAIIGTKGSYIKNIIKLSGASVKITPLSQEESKTAVERQVVIVGTPESQWKAQYYIYEKIRQERFASDENVKLRAELHVPSNIVGRIIGKSGKNVRELQRSTGATIKLPEDAAAAAGLINGQDSGSQSEVTTATGEEATTAAASSTETTTTAKTESTEQATATSTNEASETTDKPPASPSDSSSNQQQPTTGSNTTPNAQGFVIVRIFGTFQASQCAQRRIQALVSQSLRTGQTNGTSVMQQGDRSNYGQLNNHYSGRDYSQSNSQQPRMNGNYNNSNNRHNRNRHFNNNNNNNNNQQTKENNKENGQQQTANSVSPTPATTTTTTNNNGLTEQNGTTSNTVNAQSPSVSSTQPTPIVAASS